MVTGSPDSCSVVFAEDRSSQLTGTAGGEHFESGPDVRGEAASASSRIKFVRLSHRVPGRLGFVNCTHPDGHLYLVAVEVEHADGGPDLADTLVCVLDNLFDHLSLCARNSRAVTALTDISDTAPDDPDPSETAEYPHTVESAWHTDGSWIERESRSFVEQRIPAPLRGRVTAWSVRIHPADGGPGGDGSAAVHRSPKRDFFDSQEDAEGFPYGITGYTQALKDLEQYRSGSVNYAHSQARERQRAAGLIRQGIDGWSPPGAPDLWVEALRVAETGLGWYAVDVSEHLAWPPWTIGALAIALYVVSAHTGTTPQAVHRDQIAPLDCSTIPERLSALGHELTDDTDPVSACWQTLAHVYGEPEDPIAAQIYSEDSTALSGPRFTYALDDVMRAWTRLWPGGTIVPLEQMPAVD